MSGGDCNVGGGNCEVRKGPASLLECGMNCALRSLLASLISISVWGEPSFEEMVAEAQLIAHCRVLKGGTLSATVSAIETLKGEAPGKPFLVGGFNSHTRPPDLQEKETFRKDEEYLLILRPSERVHAGFEITESVQTHLMQMVADGLIAKADLADQRRYYESPLYQAGHLVTSPVTGDFPVRDGRVQGDWFRPENPRESAWVPAEMAFGLIRGLVAKQAGESTKIARGILQRQLTKDLLSAITPADNPEMHERVARFRWLMCAQAAFGGADMQGLIELAVAQDTPSMRLFAARALRSLPESRATLGLIAPLLGAPESQVQAEAAESLVQGNFSPIAANLLIDALATSRVESARAAMIRAITHFKRDDEALLDFIRVDQLNAGILAALLDHYRQHPNPEARKRFIREANRSPAESAHLFMDLLFEDDSDAARAVLRSKLMDPRIAAEVRLRWLRRYYLRYGGDEQTFGQALELLKGQRRSRTASEELLALRMIRILSSGDNPIAALPEFDLVDCVELMLYFRPGHALNKPALLYLLKEHAADPQAMACTLLLPDAEVLFALDKPPNTEGIESRLLVQKAQRLTAAESVPMARQIALWLRMLEQADDDGMRGIFWACLARAVQADAESAAPILGPVMRSLLSRGTPDQAQALSLLQAVGITLTSKQGKALTADRRATRDWSAIFATQK